MEAELPSPPPVPDFAGARRAMIESQLRPEGVTDQSVLAAMDAVPRERFVAEGMGARAYSDRPVPAAGGGSLMPPAALARLLTELAPRRGERALVVGAGNGYAAAVLAAMGLDVESANAVPADKAAYDVILIDGAVEELPAGLAGLLSPAGRLGTGIVDRGVTRLAVGRAAGGAIGLKRFADAEVPLLGGFARPPVFTF